MGEDHKSPSSWVQAIIRHNYTFWVAQLQAALQLQLHLLFLQLKGPKQYWQLEDLKHKNWKYTSLES